MTYAGKAWQYVVLVAAMLLNRAAEPWPSTPQGEAVRDSQFAIGGAIAVFFLYVAITLTNRQKPDKDDPHTQLVNKALSMAPPGGTITKQWYDSVCAGVKKLETWLGLGALAGVGVLLWLARPQSLWYALGSWIEDGYKDLLARYTQKQLFIGGLMVSHLAAHWGMGLFFLPFDLLRPKALLPYKLQPEYTLTWSDLGRAVAVALMNQLILLGCGYLLWDIYPLISPDGFSERIPGVLPQVVSILAFLPFTDFFFFWPHWCFHKVQWLYDHIHVIHHSFMAPISITCIYAHPVEFLLGNVTIVGFGPYVFGSHVTTWWLWTFVSTVGTSIAHSGWRLPIPIFSADPGHDYHHSNVSGPEGPQNIGNSGVTDAFMHTNDFYNTRSWQAKTGAYSSLDFPLVKILAQKHALPGQGDGGEPALHTAPVKQVDGLVDV